MRKINLLGILVMLGLLAACGTATPSSTAVPTSTMAGMDHGHGATSSPGSPYDANFIDSMIMHHESAVSMAKQAQQSADHPEIRTMAEAIIATQSAEISQMKTWRTSWYPDLATGTGVAMDMGQMDVAEGSTPFDQRFLEAMISHHEGAITMAKDAQQKAEHPEIKNLAEAIIKAQEAEITQMKAWLKAWYGVEK